MPSGMQVFNTSGTLVADMTTPTLTLRNKITVTVPAGAGAIRFVDQLFANCDIPVFAFRPNGANRNFFADVSTVVGQPTQRSVRCYTAAEWFFDTEGSDPATMDTNNTTSFTVTIYHFDRPAAPAPGAGFGLQMFDELGRPTFDSNQKPAKVLRALTGAFGYDDFTFPNSVAPAVIPSHNWRYQIDSNAFGYYELWYRENWRFGGNRVESFDLFLHNALLISPTSHLDRPNGRSSGIFVDVLGY